MTLTQQQQSWLMLCSISLIWGSSFILMKKALLTFDYIQVATLRICISALVFLPFLYKSIPYLKSGKAYYILAFAVLNAGIPPFLFTKAQTQLDSSVAGVLNGLTPIFTLFIGVLFFGIKFRGLQLIGVMIGLIGAAGLVLLKGSGVEAFQQFDSSDAIYASYIIIATICYALSSHILKHFLSEVPATVTIASGFVMVGIPMYLYLFLFNDFRADFKVAPNAWEAVGYVSILAVLGTAVALFLFHLLVKKSDALFASFVTYLIPFVALFWGVLDGERFSFAQVLSMLLILLGIFLANFSKNKKKVAEVLGESG